LDLNGDGHPDAIAGNFVFAGHSGGSFGPVQTVTTKGTAAFAPIVRGGLPAVFYVYVNGNEVEYRLNNSKP
jgi:hypothetical protein